MSNGNSNYLLETESTMENRNLMIIGGTFLAVVAVVIVVFTTGILNPADTSEGTSMSLDGDLGSSETAVATKAIYENLQGASGVDGTQYMAVEQGDQVVLRDQTSGTEVAVIRQLSDQEVMIQGRVASLNALSAAEKEEVQRRVSEYNTSGSSVGTLSYNEASGELLLEHRVNPQQNSAKEMAAVVVRFSDEARRQSKEFSSMLVASNPS